MAALGGYSKPPTPAWALEAAEKLMLPPIKLGKSMLAILGEPREEGWLDWLR